MNCNEMNKNTYEAYEFLPTNSTETNADQFFVVQDDGTFLINRQVQYVAQVQDVKEALEDVQPCTVYDVSSQQFFVDVDNSTELISVSDQFILPDGGSELYNNSYLLQPTSSTTAVEQMNEDVIVDQYKETDAQESNTTPTSAVTQTLKQTNNLTEITLNDEQYQTLEQKGWILLESNDKIYVLDTLGLHDITSNEKLIHKLKNDIQSSTGALEAGCVKIDNIESQLPYIAPQTPSNQQETVELVVGNNDEQDSNSAIETIQFVVDEKEIIQDIIAKETTPPPLDIEPENKSIRVEIVQSELDAKSLKIKTKLNFPDIPDKIILGKTVNGKKLVAKVTKRQSSTKNDIMTEAPKGVAAVVYEDTIDNQHYNVTGLFESEFVSLIQQSVRGRMRGMCTLEDVSSADTIVTELLKVPSMKESLIGQNLVITKIATDKTDNGEFNNKSKVKMVTGRVISKDKFCAFEYLPNMLQKITRLDVQKPPENDNMNAVEDLKSIAIFHIHITETKCVDNIVRVSVTLNKRQLPVNLVFDLKRRYPSTVFACSACAAMFKSESALKEHQETQCLDSDDMLTIDTDTNVTCSVLKGEKDKVYTCTLCEAKFTKLSNCQRHVKTHTAPSQQGSEPDTTLTSTNQEDLPKRPIQVYKCKMCPSTYFHSSTLSKHIVTRHINVKSK